MILFRKWERKWDFFTGVEKLILLLLAKKKNVEEKFSTVMSDKNRASHKIWGRGVNKKTSQMNRFLCTTLKI